MSLARRRDEARLVPTTWTSQAMAAFDGASVPVTPATDAVDCSVFAPPACPPGDTAFVQVFAHLPDQAALAASLATEFDQEAVRRAVRSLMAPVARGDTLVFDLSFRDLPVPDPVQALVWQGKPDSVQFEVPVPASMRLGTVVGTVAVSLRSIPVGHVKFKLEIANAAQEDARPVGDAAQRYGRAFISYASADRDQVVRRVQMLGPLGIRFFQDVLDLEPGERWERPLFREIEACDLFLLFWSSAARRSNGSAARFTTPWSARRATTSRRPRSGPSSSRGRRSFSPGRSSPTSTSTTAWCSCSARRRLPPRFARDCRGSTTATTWRSCTRSPRSRPTCSTASVSSSAGCGATEMGAPLLGPAAKGPLSTCAGPGPGVLGDRRAR